MTDPLTWAYFIDQWKAHWWVLPLLVPYGASWAYFIWLLRAIRRERREA